MRKLFLVGTLALILITIGMFTIKMTTPLVVASVYNLIRCIAIGCLMMPLVTWGIDSIDSKNTAHGTALLTSFRTIAGAVGSAVFVGIMTMVQNISKDTYLENADIHGLNVTFLAMSVVSAVMFVIGIFFVKSKKNDDDMTIKELAKKLKKNKNIPKDAYHIIYYGGYEYPSESYCLNIVNGKYEYYYSERGHKNCLIEFDNETEACEYFYNLMMDMFNK